MVDTSNASRLKESKLELKRILNDNRVACKPLLILSNKTEMRNLGKNDTSMDICGNVINNLDLQGFLEEPGRKTIQPKVNLYYTIRTCSSAPLVHVCLCAVCYLLVSMYHSD